MDREGGEIKIKFQPVTSHEIEQEFSSDTVDVTVHSEQEQKGENSI